MGNTPSASTSSAVFHALPVSKPARSRRVVAWASLAIPSWSTFSVRSLRSRIGLVSASAFFRGAVSACATATRPAVAMTAGAALNRIFIFDPPGTLLLDGAPLRHGRPEGASAVPGPFGADRRNQGSAAGISHRNAPRGAGCELGAVQESAREAVQQVHHEHHEQHGQTTPERYRIALEQRRP